MKFNTFSSTPGQVLVHIGLVLVQWFKRSPCGPVLKLPLEIFDPLLDRVKRGTKLFGVCQAQFQLTSQVTSRTDLALNLEITYPLDTLHSDYVYLHIYPL